MAKTNYKMKTSLLVSFYEQLLEKGKIKKGGKAHQRLKKLSAQYDRWDIHNKYNYKKLYKEYRDEN